MPIPTPNDNETQEQFIDRCMIDDTMVAEYDDDQRLAICIAQIEEERGISDIDFTPTQAMIDNAKQGLEWREEFERGGTDVGVATANAIIDKKITADRTKRIFSYLSRHEVDKDAEGFNDGEDGFPSAGRIAWELWGGDEAFVWSADKVKEIKEMEENKLENTPQEMRTNPDKEIRTFNVENLELRQEGEDNVVVGYGSVFNTLSNELGGFREIISEGAFDGRLEDDVRFLINHDGLPLARTTNGTLRLSTDERGLKYEAKVANTSLGRDLIELMRNGTINQSSFAFVVEDDSWEVKDGMNVRTINKVSRLYDVSAVTYPAYEEASVALRSMEAWKQQEEEKVMKENLEKEKEEREKEEMDLTKRSLAELRLSIINKK
jgi:HK97 family phage prohead protease